MYAYLVAVQPTYLANSSRNISRLINRRCEWPRRRLKDIYLSVKDPTIYWVIHVRSLVVHMVYLPYIYNTSVSKKKVLGSVYT